ncbi:hypothetical protein RJT34_11875 [Clitoria ternatea]|uniref:Uncharacterized protein n=1 Tax=Clitoria ternatea TaxID=43366 RepID=A0AAN9JKR2_CLITE
MQPWRRPVNVDAHQDLLRRRRRLLVCRFLGSGETVEASSVTAGWRKADGGSARAESKKNTGVVEGRPVCVGKEDAAAEEASRRRCSLGSARAKEEVAGLPFRKTRDAIKSGG